MSHALSRARRTPLAHALLLALPCLAASPAAGQTSLSDVVVRDRAPDADTTGDTRPAVTLTGPALDQRRAATLGDTLAAEPGMASTGFGPNAGRPVIRGQDGDRIRIMQNGTGSVDASALSYDHATTVEPLVLDRIEVLRGPAALRYGNTAIGGVVNGTDTRIPTQPIDRPGGRAEVRAGGADSTLATVGVVEAGNGAFAVRGDAFRRDTRDLKIPGFARSARQRALDAVQDPDRAQPAGRLPNTWSRSEGGSLGGAATWDRGYLGAAVGALRSSYGTPAEEDVKIDLRKDTLDLGGEVRGLTGAIQTLRIRVNHSDYAHQEKMRDTGAVNTTFRNRGTEGRFEAVHAPLGAWKGLVGLQSTGSAFEALGDEAYVPRTRSRGTALFAVEELDRGPWRVVVGARSEWSTARSDGAGTDAPARFGDARSRSFGARSLAATLERSLAPGLTLSATAAWAERAPSHYELFANGPHAATGAYELGDPTMGKERSQSLEAGLRWTPGTSRYAVTAFHTRYRNYLDLVPTGLSRNADGDPVDAGAADALPEYAYRQVPALFRGIEAQGRWRLAQGPTGTLHLEGRLDYVRATRADTGEPLPRIAPLRVGAALTWQREAVSLRGELTRVAAQNRVAANELPTDGYTTLDAWASWRFRQTAAGSWELFLRGANLTNVEARNHVSLLKDIAPMAGRSLSVGVRAVF